MSEKFKVGDEKTGKVSEGRRSYVDLMLYVSDIERKNPNLRVSLYHVGNKALKASENPEKIVAETARDQRFHDLASDAVHGIIDVCRPKCDDIPL
jgi:hypothetical protein